MGERIEKSHERQKDFFVGIGIMRRKSFEALISRLSHIYEVVLSWERVESEGIAQSTKISGEQEEMLVKKEKKECEKNESCTKKREGRKK